MKKQQKCYIYTRVSTSMQVDGYSFDAQKDKLHKYVDFQEMVIVGEYSDEVKSGKSVEGRLEFILFWYSSFQDLVVMLRMFLALYKECRILV